MIRPADGRVVRLRTWIAVIAVDGSGMHVLVYDENKPPQGRDIPDRVDVVSFGSDPDCHVYLPDLRVADRHFTLHRVAAGEWVLRKMEVPGDSPARHTPIYVNARDLQDDHPIHHNDEIVIARFRLRVFLHSATANAPKAAAMEEAAKIRAHPLPGGAVVRTDPFGEAHLRAGDIKRLTAFAFAVHDCTDLASFMSTCVREIQHLFGALRVRLAARRKGYGRFEFVETVKSGAKSADEPALLESYQYRCIERGQLICAPQTDEDDTESAMCVPLQTDRAILGMLYVDNRSGSGPFGEQDLDFLTVLAALIARQFELIVMELVKLQESITAGELSFLRELQSHMDPTAVPQWEQLQLAVFCKPGLERAGDLCDVMGLPNGLAAFFCANMTGAATRAALALAESRAAFRVGGLHADAPHIVLRAINWMIHDPKAPCGLATIIVVMNPRTGAMQYASAGAIGAVVVNAAGQLRSLVQAEYPPVGQEREFAYASGAGRLEEGESMFLFTPGCVNISDRRGERLAQRELLDAVSDSFGQGASTALNDLLSDLKAYFKDGRNPDDISIMVVHRE